jgi:predicted TPR repeat methyltransferase
MRLHMRHGRFAAAEALGEAARRGGAADALVLRLIGDARMKRDLFDAAVEAYQDARKLAPEDPYLRHLLAAAGRLPADDRAPPAYVSALFDGDAPRFDARLRELGYRIPAVFHDELRGRAPTSGTVLDLGCGTGLQAATSAGLALGTWIGVDLSGRMLAEAARRHLYGELHQQDVFAFLASTPRRFTVVLAGDVLPYFGDLAPVATAVASRLEDGGCFLVSTEELPGEPPDPVGWRLGRRGRFAHTRNHIAAAADAAGLKVAVLRPEIIRLEAGVPVPGLFAVLERTRA